jgi:hypothetical protein
VFELNGSCYPISFQTEEVVQSEDHTDKDDGQDDGDDPEGDDSEDDDLLDDIPKEKDNNRKEGSKGGDEKDARQKSDKGMGNQGSAGCSKSAKRSQTVRRFLDFKEPAIGQIQCTSILKAMEMEESDEDEDLTRVGQGEGAREDDEFSYLPKEWIKSLSQEKENQGQLNLTSYQTVNLSAEYISDGGEEVEDQCTQPSLELVEQFDADEVKQQKVKQEKKKEWGPLLPQIRSKRFLNDDRTMLEKAQDTKRKHNLEDNQGKKTKNP